MIDVKKKSPNTFKVTVEQGNTISRHTVNVEDAYYQKLTGGEITKEEFVRNSFEFLLAREPKESIMSRFDLPVIQRYFPEYEATISASYTPS